MKAKGTPGNLSSLEPDDGPDPAFPRADVTIPSPLTEHIFSKALGCARVGSLERGP